MPSQTDLIKPLMKSNIFLIGLMGAGKTTIGKALGRRLKRTFYDSDLELQRRIGTSISSFFKKVGEANFRIKEAEMIEELSLLSEIVLATGGGSVLRHDNRKKLRDRGIVIYLYADPCDLWSRIRNDCTRPLLRTADARSTLASLFAERDPIYRRCADFIIDTDRKPINPLVNAILAKI